MNIYILFPVSPQTCKKNICTHVPPECVTCWECHILLCVLQILETEQLPKSRWYSLFHIPPAADVAHLYQTVFFVLFFLCFRPQVLSSSVRPSGSCRIDSATKRQCLGTGPLGACQAKGVLSTELSAYVMWWGWKPEQNWAVQQAESLSK